MRTFLAAFTFFALMQDAWTATPGLETLDSSFNTPSGTEISVKNMPAVRSQDGIGLCSAFSAAALMEHEYCRKNNIADCSSLPNDQRISVLDLSRFNVDSTKLKDNSDPDDYPKRVEVDGTSSLLMLLNAGFLANSMVPESCAPFDGLLSKINNMEQATALETAIWDNFKKAYDNFKVQSKQCADCALEEATSTAKQWKENYDLKVDNVEMLRAFSAKTYQEFLSQLLIPKNCYKLGMDIQMPNEGMEVTYWPKGEEKENYKTSIDKIKSILKTDQPIIADLCLLERMTPGCTEKTKSGSISGGHSVLVTGYRKMCNSAGKCYETLRIHNSWGQSWQDQNDGGWVRADEFLNRTGYDEASFVYLKEKS